MYPCSLTWRTSSRVMTSWVPRRTPAIAGLLPPGRDADPNVPDLRDRWHVEIIEPRLVHHADERTAPMEGSYGFRQLLVKSGWPVI